MDIGIDLGTTNSVVSRLDDDGEAEVIKNSGGHRKTPSVVQILEDETKVGNPAVRNKRSAADRTVERVKRHMGDDDWRVEIGGEEYRPEEISARILKKIKKDVEDRHENIDEAVITVPAYFSVKERQSTVDAAEIAGFDDVSLLNEPTAACLQYGVSKDTDEVVFVYDLGGGTFDATVVEITDTGAFQVEGVEGGQRLGGEDFDDELYQYVRQEMIEDGLPDPDENENFKADIYDEVRQVKITLSEAEKSKFAPPLGPGEDFELEITRDQFNELIEPLVNETFKHIDAMFDHENVGLSRDDVDQVLLVGGSTYVPYVQERVEEYFGIEPRKDGEQDLAVAMGAAKQTERRVNVENLGTGRGGSGSEGKPSNGHEVIASDIGVAIKDRGSGELIFEGIIEQHTPIPGGDSKRGFKKVDKQSPRIAVTILQGGEPLADDNEELGEFKLENLEPGADPEFEIDFQIDDEGLLHAEATALDSGKSADTTLDLGMSDSEIIRATKELEDALAR